MWRNGGEHIHGVSIWVDRKVACYEKVFGDVTHEHTSEIDIQPRAVHSPCLSPSSVLQKILSLHSVI